MNLNSTHLATQQHVKSTFSRKIYPGTKQVIPMKEQNVGYNFIGDEERGLHLLSKGNSSFLVKSNDY